MKRKENSLFGNRLFLVGIFALLVFGISAGYSALKTTLSINGSTTISKVGWDIHFENLDVATGSATGTAAIDPTDKTKITYTITLAQPGDFYEFETDIRNAGTLNAILQSIEETNTLTDEQKEYITYSYSYTTPVAAYIAEPFTAVTDTVSGIPAKNDLLDAKKVARLKVRIDFSDDITPAQLPTEDSVVSFTYKLNYAQN